MSATGQKNNLSLLDAIKDYNSFQVKIWPFFEMEITMNN